MDIPKVEIIWSNGKLWLHIDDATTKYSKYFSDEDIVRLSRIAAAATAKEGGVRLAFMLFPRETAHQKLHPQEAQ